MRIERLDEVLERLTITEEAETNHARACYRAGELAGAARDDPGEVGRLPGLVERLEGEITELGQTLRTVELEAKAGGGGQQGALSIAKFGRIAELAQSDELSEHGTRAKLFERHVDENRRLREEIERVELEKTDLRAKLETIHYQAELCDERQTGATAPEVVAILEESELPPARPSVLEEDFA